MGDSDKLGYDHSHGRSLPKNQLMWEVRSCLDARPGCMRALEVLALAGGVLVWPCEEQGTSFAVLLE